MKDVPAEGREAARFSRALAGNAKALGIFDAMAPEEKQRVLQRARQLETMEETEEFVDSLVGWEEGHPPYHC